MLIRSFRVKVLVAIVATVFFVPITSAQPSNCSLKLDQLSQPAELKGFRLGMTEQQVKAVVPLVQLGAADEFGVLKTSINPHFDPGFDKTTFADVRTISFDFLDGKLVTLWIGYEENFKWLALDNFVANFSKALGVPSEWPVKRPGRQLNCDGFSILGSIIAAGPSLRITDEEAQNVIAVRREEAAEAAETQAIGDSRKKTYYLSDCSAKDDVPPAARVVFKNKDEAEKAGYKLAKDCE
jgi:hypothetical protein